MIARKSLSEVIDKILFLRRVEGALCDPAAFDGVVVVPTGILGPRHGAVAVALVEPSHAPPDHTWAYTVFTQNVFAHTVPSVVLTILQEKNLVP